MKLLILALCVVAAASKKAGKRTSNLIFTHESGAQTRIGFDGTKLTVPGYCEQDTCTAAASERASHTSQLSGLEARVGRSAASVMDVSDDSTSPSVTRASSSSMVGEMSGALSPNCGNGAVQASRSAWASFFSVF